jgi:hypothetical protein
MWFMGAENPSSKISCHRATHWPRHYDRFFLSGLRLIVSNKKIISGIHFALKPLFRIRVFCAADATV